MDVEASRLIEDDDLVALSASCLFLSYDPVSRQCTLVNAGQPPPLLRDADGSVRSLDLLTHPPLGMRQIMFETTTINVFDGSVIALYTDGLIDLRRHDAAEAFSRLTTALSSEVEELDQLCFEVSEKALRDDQDDAALLLARFTGIPADDIVTWELPVSPEAVGRLRKAVVHQLDRWGLAHLSESTQSIVTELATNALIHSAEPATLRLIRHSALTCEMADASRAAPRPRNAEALDENGRGLTLVAGLSDQWGTRYTDEGKIVWAEQHLS